MNNMNNHIELSTVDPSYLLAQDNSTSNWEQILARFPVSTQTELLLDACKKNLVDRVKAIIQVRPQLASYGNNKGSTAVHISAFHGHCVIVEILVALDPDLCDMRDNEYKIPLHIAAENGRTDVLAVLIGARPDSVKCQASLGRNALHLSALKGQSESFQILMEELHRTNQLGVLNNKDHNGDTVLHIATSHNQFQILNLLLQQNYCPRNCPLLDVNSKNGKGLTPLAIHTSTNDQETDYWLIHNLLVRAGATEGRSYHSNYYNKEQEEDQGMVLKTMSLTAKSIFLAVLILFAGGSYGSLSYFQSVYPPPQHTYPDLTLFELNLFPQGFHYITLNAVTFTVSMFMILVLMWSLHTPWTFYFRLVGFFLMTVSSIAFGLMVHELVPRFLLHTFGSHKISSFEAVWLYDFGLIVLVFALGIFLKLILAIF